MSGFKNITLSACSDTHQKIDIMTAERYQINTYFLYTSPPGRLNFIRERNVLLRVLDVFLCKFALGGRLLQKKVGDAFCNLW